MAEEWITKTKRVRVQDGEHAGEMAEVATKFRVDADFIPDDINQVSLEFIINYCKAHKEVKWLKETAEKTITDKQGKVRDYPFVNLRSDFMKKFFSDKVKGKAEKKPTMYDLIKAL